MSKRSHREYCVKLEDDLRVKMRDDDEENKMSKRSHREDCVKLEKDLRVKMRDDEEKEVDIGAVNTQTDQLLPGKSYLYQFFISYNSTNLELKKA